MIRIGRKKVTPILNEIAISDPMLRRHFLSQMRRIVPYGITHDYTMKAPLRCFNLVIFVTN